MESGCRFPFYLLHGDEDFGRDATCAWLVQKIGPDTATEFNFDLFHGDAFECERFLDLYNAYPMMSSHRLIVVKACDKLTADQCRAVEVIAADPPDTTVLIAAGAKVDMRRKLWQQLSRKGLAVHFRTPYDNEIPRWISEYAGARGLRLEPGLPDLLHLYVGNNLRELAGELEKLTTYVGEGETITRRALEDLVGTSRSTSIFEFTDAVGQRRYPRAQELLHSLMAQGEDPTRIVAMISRHLQLLLKVQQLERSGATRGEIAKSLGISPFFLGSYRKQAARLGRGALWDGLRILLRADSRLKSLGRRQQPTVMDLTLSELTGRLQDERG